MLCCLAPTSTRDVKGYSYQPQYQQSWCDTHKASAQSMPIHLEVGCRVHRVPHRLFRPLLHPNEPSRMYPWRTGCVPPASPVS